MYSQVAEGTMSSSRIIKSLQTATDNPRDFCFRPIGHIADETVSDTAGCFVPMAMFDTSEMLDNTPHAVVEQDTSQAPAGITLTEEELDRRLHASFDSGLQEGKNLAERGLLNVFKSLRTAAEDLHALREKVVRESEDELVKLIMMVARKVILREVVQDRRILSDVVQGAIAGLSERDEIIIRLNPDDYALVTTSREDYLRKELLTDRMQLKPDSSILPGSCKIDMEMGTIDAGIDAQLDEIFRRLLEERSMSTGVDA